MYSLFVRLLLCILVALPLATSAQSFRATAEAAIVEVGKPLRVQYKVSSEEARDLQFPAFVGFQRIAGPYTSIDKQGRTATYTFTLRATAPGHYTIPAATIEVNGKRLTSNTIKMQVIPESKQEAESTTLPEIKASDLFVQATLDKTHCFTQEAVLLTYRIYTLTRLHLNGNYDMQLPDFQSFHAQEVPLNGGQTVQFEQRGDQSYRHFVVRQFLLFPQTDGTLTIPAASFQVSVVQRTDASTDAQLQGRGLRIKQHTIKTTPLQLTARPLPLPKPENFSGAVGHFTLSATHAPKNVETGIPLTFKLSLEGQGNMKLITAPELNFPAVFECYDVKTEERVKTTTKSISGTKTFEYPLVAQESGTYQLPAVRFCYFDPVRREYVQLTTSAQTIQIKKNTNPSAREEEAANETTTSLPSSSHHSALWLLLLPAIGGALWWYLRRSKQRNAPRIRPNWTQAELLLKQNQQEAYYDELSRVLWLYLNTRLNLPPTKQNKQEARQTLRARGVSEEVTDGYLRMLDDCEQIRYASVSTGETPASALERARQAVASLNHALSAKS